MINETDLEQIRTHFIEYDSLRETIIKDSRDVLKSSKKLIVRLHGNDIKGALELKKEAETSLKQLNITIKKHPALQYEGSYNAALQEYCEAQLFYGFMKSRTLLPTDKLNVGDENYLLGVFDLTGELGRLAVNSAIREEYAIILEIKDFVTKIYDVLLTFDFRNGEIRKKFDSVKWNLKKIEEIVYDLKIKNKI